MCAVEGWEAGIEGCCRGDGWEVVVWECAREVVGHFSLSGKLWSRKARRDCG